ncbi:MAG TPA: hypothetical protein VK453_12120 [Micromonosporaceae bacterium]|nr:hypothetical protein [Micromonosporaceae bacterium]
MNADDTPPNTAEHPVRVMLDAVLACPVPDGFTSAYRQRHSARFNYTVRDVTISPVGLDVSTFTFGVSGAYAHIGVNHTNTYTVGVFATDVAYNVQSAGRAVAFTSADDAVRCALDEIRGHLRRQQRGW